MKLSEKATRTIERCEITLPGSAVTMTFCRIPKGEFRMGSRGYDLWEEPAHVMRVEQDFWLGQYPVTQEQLAVWTTMTEIYHQNQFPGRSSNPAENITWTKATRFCVWLTTEAGNQFPAGYSLACLPTEAEWEYGCRAGTETEYHTGNGEIALTEAGWYNNNSEHSTHPVGEKPANVWGLYDMHGNVWEFCHDRWDEAAYRKRRVRNTDVGYAARAEEYLRGRNALLQSEEPRVLRGGSWFYSAWYCRSANRGRWRPVGTSGHLGFRVCLIPIRAATGSHREGLGEGGGYLRQGRSKRQVGEKTRFGQSMLLKA